MLQRRWAKVFFLHFLRCLFSLHLCITIVRLSSVFFILLGFPLPFPFLSWVIVLSSTINHCSSHSRWVPDTFWYDILPICSDASPLTSSLCYFLPSLSYLHLMIEHFLIFSSPSLYALESFHPFIQRRTWLEVTARQFFVPWESSVVEMMSIWRTFQPETRSVAHNRGASLITSVSRSHSRWLMFHSH